MQSDVETASFLCAARRVHCKYLYLRYGMQQQATPICCKPLVSDIADFVPFNTSAPGRDIKDASSAGTVA